MSSRTPGSHGCSGSNLGSDGVTDCPAVVHTRIGPKPSPTAPPKLCSHNLPNERAKWLCCVQVTIVHVRGHYRTSRTPARDRPMHQLPTLLSSTTLSRQGSAENVSAALTSTLRPTRSSDTTYSLAFTARLIAPASSPSCHNTCNAGASGNREPSVHDQPTSETHDEVSTRSGNTVHSTSALAHWASQFVEQCSLFQEHHDVMLDVAS